MVNDGILDEETIGDIILCDPITSNGKECLDRLGLTIEDVSPTYFYDKLRVASKYDESKSYSPKILDRNPLYYQYSVDFEQFNSLQKQLADFNARFESDLQNQYPLLILGVAGNGKSIEVNRRIREITSGNTEYECGRAYINLEDAFTKKTYGVTYSCPEKSPLWLFCIKLLDGIMQYILHCHALCTTIRDNFNDIFVARNIANNEQKQLIMNIGNYQDGDVQKETEIFQSLISLLDLQKADKCIQTLLEILMFIMYCSDINKKHYIVIDNIEQYIELNDLKIQIPNSDITTISKIINELVTNMASEFNRIENNLVWKAFKIIVVLRRTSIALLDPVLLQSPIKANHNINDMTGHIQIPDIWFNKKKYILDEKLYGIFTGSDNEFLLKLIDIVMNDGEQAAGLDYQSIIAPLMSYGIRRNARSQAHSIYKTYEIVNDKSEMTVNRKEFEHLMSVMNHENSTVRYMFRRALIEIQFKWSMYGGNQNRWKKLNLGHLKESKEILFGTNRITIEEVAYDNNECVTLVRRILSYLSYFIDENSTLENGKNKSVAEMFSTRSLYDLIEGVLVDPSGKRIPSEEELLQLARVLMALSDMSNGDTKGAPFVLLFVKDENFHTNTYESVFANILQKIWQAGKKGSLPGEKYSYNDFGVRLNDAGYSFLLDWQASFSFMASLYCFTIPPLFFLKDFFSIKYVISTVYNETDKLCKKYEAEAIRFCGTKMTLKTKMYIPKSKGNYITFKQRVKELHMNHLILYKTFIENNYTILKMSERDKEELVKDNSGLINIYFNKYKEWETNGGAPECF